MGLACLSGAFKRAGLAYDLYYDTIQLTYKDVHCGYLRAAVLLFAISSEQAQFLFNPVSYNGNQQGAKGERVVARRIRDFVAGKITGK